MTGSTSDTNKLRWKRRIRRRIDLARLVNGGRSLLLVTMIFAVGKGRLVSAVDQSNPRDSSEITGQAESLRAEQYAIASKLLERYPRDFDALRIMGYVHSSHGNLEQMFECWQQCRQLQPDRADIREQLGRYAFQSEQYTQALQHWKAALKINPRMKGIYQQVGDALLNLGRPEDARRALQQEIKLAPDASQAHYLLGEALFQLQDFAAAKQSYLEAARLAPSNRHAYYGLIKSCTRLGQSEEAAAHAKAFQRLENKADAADMEFRRLFDDLQQIREKVAVTCIDTGRVYLRNQQREAAARLWSRAAALDPKNISCRRLLAELYTKQRRLPKAIEQYQELVKLQPRNIGHQQQLGLLYARGGNTRAAEQAFKRMLETAPENAAAHRMLAKFYLNTNQQSAVALRLATRAVKLEPIADSFFVLGWSNAKAGRPADALAALKEATRLEPDNATYRKLYDLVQKASPKSKSKGN